MFVLRQNVGCLGGTNALKRGVFCGVRFKIILSKKAANVMFLYEL